MLRRTACFAAAAMLLALTRSVSRGETAPDVFPSIPDVRANGGVVSLELDVALDPVNGSATFEYGGIVGLAPTIRVRPGQTIAMTVHNAMPALPGQPDDVNVHFHGLTVSPQAPGDDVLTTLAPPGGTLRYRIGFPPITNRVCTGIIRTRTAPPTRKSRTGCPGPSSSRACKNIFRNCRDARTHPRAARRPHRAKRDERGHADVGHGRHDRNGAPAKPGRRPAQSY